MPKSTINGIEMSYQDLNAQAEGTPVLLVTGFGGVGASWGPLIPLFAAQRRTIVPDHRGCGQSTHTVNGQNIPQLASDMAALVASLGCGPVHVVGSSTGGAIGQRMAIEHRETVKSLSAVGSWGRSDDYFSSWFRLRRQVLLDLPYAAHVELSQFLLYSPDYWNRYTEHRLGERQAMIADGGESREIFAARMQMLLDHDVLEQLAQITLPATVMTGTADVICPPYLGKELAAAIPGATFTLLEGCGHYAHEENPQLVYDTVEAMIAKID